MFEKEHAKVIRSIRELNCGAAFTEANFGLSTYKDVTGRSLPEYLITRDGFTFIATTASQKADISPFVQLRAF